MGCRSCGDGTWYKVKIGLDRLNDWPSTGVYISSFKSITRIPLPCFLKYRPLAATNRHTLCTHGNGQTPPAPLTPSTGTAKSCAPTTPIFLSPHPQWNSGLGISSRPRGGGGKPCVLSAVHGVFLCATRQTNVVGAGMDMVG